MALSEQQKTALRAEIVAKAVSHLGAEEQPRYSNRDAGGVIDQANEYVGNSPASEPAWCLAFGVFCVGKSAEQQGLSLADTNIERTGYCPSEYTHAKSLGAAIDPQSVVEGTGTAAPGDLVLFFYDSEDGGTLPHHCEIVEIPPAHGRPAFTTIGGNTVPQGYTGDDGGQGFGVFRKAHIATELNPSGHNHFVFIRTV